MNHLSSVVVVNPQRHLLNKLTAVITDTIHSDTHSDKTLLANILSDNNCKQ